MSTEKIEYTYEEAKEKIEEIKRETIKTYEKRIENIRISHEKEISLFEKKIEGLENQLERRSLALKQAKSLKKDLDVEKKKYLEENSDFKKKIDSQTMDLLEIMNQNRDLRFQLEKSEEKEKEENHNMNDANLQNLRSSISEKNISHSRSLNPVSKTQNLVKPDPPVIQISKSNKSKNENPQKESQNQTKKNKKRFLFWRKNSKKK
ncbi:hypothetical protein M0811_09420 [Anaeramoeba ignava]|uniref:Uncharacterized protein n=1 Tax=Anaeramoeba ignava TaxID=1746090 RepID=A0A9Q0LH92_ANAIG|nr:hypothetical protein M0811_09420 [Anaeramoeba ignava]